MTHAFDVSNEAHQKKWQRLLLYENGKSLVSSKTFFISTNGQNSSEDELRETLKIFGPAIGKSYAPNEQLPAQIVKFACEFPARFNYLSTRLNIEKKYYICNDYETWRDSFEASGISVIFASQYLENPASAFGHTFLKINSEKKALYLNKVVSFAASVPEDVSAYSYIYKGIFGGFDSFFSVYPFYLTFQEYANLERRDLWEYELNLTQVQTKELLSNIYELINKASVDYSFLSKNCSGMILRLLEAEFDKDLLVDLPFYISPIESIKVLVKNNLVQKINYHPSITSRLNKLSKNLSLADSKKISSLVEDRTTLTKNDSVDVLDFGIEYLNFIRQKNAGKFIPEDEELFRTLINARASKTEDSSDTSNQENLLYPEKSSGIQRASIGMRSQNHDKKVALSYRPAGKDFFDRPNGFLKESEINVLKTQIYLDTEKPKKNFFSLNILGLKKYVDYDVINKNTSWGVNLAVKSDPLSLCQSCYFVEVDSFYGIGKSIFDSNLLTYLVAHPLLQYGNLAHHHYSFLPQAEIGAIFSDEEYVLKSSFFYGYKINGQKKEWFNDISTSITKIFRNNYALALTHIYYGIYSKNIYEIALLYSF